MATPHQSFNYILDLLEDMTDDTEVFVCKFRETLPNICDSPNLLLKLEEEIWKYCEYDVNHWLYGELWHNLSYQSNISGLDTLVRSETADLAIKSLLSADYEDNNTIAKIVNMYPTNISIESVLQYVLCIDDIVISWLNILLQYLRPKDLIFETGLGNIEELIKVFPDDISSTSDKLVIKNNYGVFLEATLPLMRYRGDVNVVNLLSQY